MPLNRTLGEMASKLQVRLGFGAAGARAGVNLPMMYDMLFASQVQLYWENDWQPLRHYVVKTLGAAQTLLDYPDELHPERITGISVNRDGIWTPNITQGIAPELYTTQTSPGSPVRYDLYSQIEFWPEPDQIYNVRIFGMKPLNPFTEEGHETTLDPDLVFLHALALGKAHYRHSDAQFYADQLAAMMVKVRTANIAKRVYDRRERDTIVNPRPLVVGRDI